MNASASTPPRRALDGVRVLDLSRVLAGPWCAQLLGDLGADVVKVESPGRGDDARELGVALDSPTPGPGRDSNFFLACNRNKRSIAIDFSKHAGAELVRTLVSDCDVLVENFKAGTLRRYGLDWDSLKTINPRLVYCSVTGFGQDGPYASRPAYDFVMQAMTGMMSTCGMPDGTPSAAPMRTAIPATDLVTGYQASVAVLGALIQRGITGRGQFIDAAMLDASVAFNVHLAQGFLLSGQAPTRQGNNNPIAAPSGVFKTANGWLVVAAGNDRQFVSLCNVLGCPALATLPLFATNGQRVVSRLALHAEIDPLLAAHTTEHWLPLLEAAHVPTTRINTMDQVFDDPQVLHRQMTVEVDHASGQRIPILRSALNMSDSPVHYRAPPQLGQHTHEVLTQWAALDEVRIDELHAAGVVEGR
ncbi:CaiB/BaiF CoA transferase family protein [Variovorax sp. PAMC 28711]|uniref:CaiB/BaiF CoA transferase family protein n=1 Tax=Variovorax sp. PAMC 28711 TaxID=1795631 RepID=UPI00078B6450|nr:CoA transferase [Variovorax sp. PAMC 28711]AMM24383.1 CoA-transferase [Variovorax sp. PAMC 28711]